MEHPDTFTSVNNLAFLLMKKGDYASAEQLFFRALEAQERVLGMEHPDTFTSVNNLAFLLMKKGDYASAEQLFFRALEARERVLGKEHPDTLTSVNDFGVLLIKKRDYAGAEPLFLRALEARERVLGKEHPDTLTSVNDLGVLLIKKRDYTGAEPLLLRTLEARERVLGKEHPDTLTSVNDLAVLFNNKGDLVSAESLYRSALEALERVLGMEHPDTLISMNNLAVLLNKKRDYVGAELLFLRALEARERVLGKEHPDTLTSVNDLAFMLKDKGDYADAEPLFRRVLEARERVLGKEHPDTLTGVNDLGVLLVKKRDYTGAEPLFRRALEARERVLGEEHPDTLTSLNNLAFLLDNKGDLVGAEPLYRHALEARERVLGKEHPDTLTSVNNLAVLLDNQRDYADAEPLYRRALEARERVLGKEHPDTLTSVNNLAFMLKDKGDYAIAEPLFRRALETCERVLGPLHPNTATYRNNLELLHKVKGNYGATDTSEILKKKFIIYRHPIYGDEVVKIGISWPGFFFGIIWMFSKKLWIDSLALIVSYLCLVLMLSIPFFVGYPSRNAQILINSMGIFLLIFMWFLPGFSGNFWRERNLSKREYTKVGTINVSSLKSAIASFYNTTEESNLRIMKGNKNVRDLRSWQEYIKDIKNGLVEFRLAIPEFIEMIRDAFDVQLETDKAEIDQSIIELRKYVHAFIMILFIPSIIFVAICLPATIIFSDMNGFDWTKILFFNDLPNNMIMRKWITLPLPIPGSSIRLPLLFSFLTLYGIIGLIASLLIFSNSVIRIFLTSIGIFQGYNLVYCGMLYSNTLGLTHYKLEPHKLFNLKLIYILLIYYLFEALSDLFTKKGFRGDKQRFFFPGAQVLITGWLLEKEFNNNAIILNGIAYLVCTFLSIYAFEKIITCILSFLKKIRIDYGQYGKFIKPIIFDSSYLLYASKLSWKENKYLIIPGCLLIFLWPMVIYFVVKYISLG
jgi:tetratricopeptide (TPR) repeat protein